MKEPLFVIFLLVNTVVSFSTLIPDIFLNSDRTVKVTEISCDYRGSFNLLQKIKQRIRILKMNENFLENDPIQNDQIFIVNLECNSSRNILKKASEQNLFSLSYKWIILHEEPFPVTKEYFRTKNILLHSDINLLEQHKNETVTLRKIYRLNGDIQVELAGTWNKNDGFTDLEIEKNIVRRRNDLKGVVLKTCLVITNNDSLNHLTDKRDKHIDSIAKANYPLIGHLSDILNATLKITSEPSWGYIVNNSNWNGMIGLLVSKEIDIGGTTAFFTKERARVVEYIALTTPARTRFIFREPKLSYVTNVYTLPFHRDVWLLIITSIIITGFLLYYIMDWEIRKQKYLPKKFRSKKKIHKFTVYDITLVSFGALCQQGSQLVPTSVPGRITIFMLFLTLMFLYTSYSANIVALLQLSSSSIQTLQDLLESKLEIAVDDTVYNKFYFPNADEPIRKAIYQHKIAPPGQNPRFIPILEGVKKVREGLFAFHVETGPGYKLISELFHENENCGLQEIRFLEVTDPWLPIQKNSPYKELLKIGVRKIHESGIQSREVGLIYTKKPQCVSRESTFISVGIVDSYPAAAVLAAGMIASFLIWIIEVILNKRSSLVECCKKLQRTKRLKTLLFSKHNQKI